MEKSDTITGLAAALAKAQASYLPVKQGGKVDYMTSKGRKKYTYATLSEIFEAVRKALSENGLAILQPTKMNDKVLVVETFLCHSSGEWIKGEIIIEPIGTKDPQALDSALTYDPQALGSAMTYARRYALSAMLGIAAEEDDDAESASKQRQGEAAVEKKNEAPPPPGEAESKLAGHWCAEHQTVFFKKGGMRNFAHPLKDEAGNATGKWCNEPKADTIKVESEVANLLIEPIDMAWLKESLDTLQWTDVGKHLRKKYSVEGTKISEMVTNLSVEQTAEFVTEVQKRLDEMRAESEIFEAVHKALSENGRR